MTTTATESIVTNKQLGESPAGCDCTFVKMGGAGLKVYEGEEGREERDEQFRLQQLFHKIGLAPEAWFCFDFTGPNGEDMFAYYSEIVQNTNDENANWIDYDRAANKLRRTLECEHGIIWTDNHSGNVGRRTDGTFVIIDFGYMRLSNCLDY